MFENFQSMIQEKIDDFTNCKTDISNSYLYQNFKTPIEYLPQNDLYKVDPIVATDLEIEFNDSSSNLTNTMYDHLMNPIDVFHKKSIMKNDIYTTNTDFLCDTQNVIKNMSQFNETDCSNVNSHEFLEIWKETKQNPWFLDKYCYIDWKIFRHFNNSSFFLQTLSFLNMTSPLLALIVPFFFLIFPFLILKFQGIPISFDTYIRVLKEIARNHFIGKILNISSMKFENVLYILFTIGLYFVQLYQNINICMKFYNNISKVNEYLSNMKNYLKTTIHKMDNFIEYNQNLKYYNEFNSITNDHCEILKQLKYELDSIEPFYPSLLKTTEIGYLLKMFYVIHSNPQYDFSLKYSVGFNGYINVLKGIHKNIENNYVNFASFSKKKTFFKEQYYPPLHKEEKVIKNNCIVGKNIITGPNASGKTTLLKTTALNIIFTQQYGVGFYSSCVLNPYTHIHSYLNIPDTSGRDSLFQAESRRCKEIINIIENNTNHRHFTIFDELFSGTNPVEASKSAYAFLLYLSKFDNVDFILTTHYTSICKKLQNISNIRNYKMDVLLENNKLTYTYKIKKGISKIQGALIVLEEMKFPNEIIDCIKNY